MAKHKITIGGQFTLEGPHGSWATVTLTELQGPQAVLEIKSHRTTVKESTPPGPLSLPTQEALMHAVDFARVALEKLKEDLPELMEPLALLHQASIAANKELAKLELPPSQQRRK